MAEINESLHPQTHNLAALDPKSLLLSQFSDAEKPQLLQLTTESFILERGPRFKEYSHLRDRKLRMKNSIDQRSPEKAPDQTVQNRPILTPPKKQVKFSSNFLTPPKKPKAPPSALAQSVPDFSSALRKENRKPAAPPPASLTPPPKSGSIYAKVGGGSKSANSAEKRIGGLMARKSYASMEELKASRNFTNAENRGGRITRGVAKTVLGSRQF